MTSDTAAERVAQRVGSIRLAIITAGPGQAQEGQWQEA
jgi:hypothetical protein